MTWAKFRRLIETDEAAAAAWAAGRPDARGRAAALGWLARFAAGDPVPHAYAAERAAAEGNDAFERSTARAWEVAALAERGEARRAAESLAAAAGEADRATPAGSRAEAWLLLMNAGFGLGVEAVRPIAERIRRDAAANPHWRMLRAEREAAALLTRLDAAAGGAFAAGVDDEARRRRCQREAGGGGRGPRPFFW